MPVSRRFYDVTSFAPFLLRCSFVLFLIFLLQVLPLDLLGQHTTISIGTRNSLSIFTGRAVLASLRHDNEANTHQ